MRNLELPGRSAVIAQDGMAATSHPLASFTAIDILKKGGNAMDAAIAACAVQCVVEPQSTGVAGDCFCLYAPKGKDEIIAYNGSGTAPRAAEPEWFLEQGIKKIDIYSPHAVSIPGSVDAWATLASDHGTMALDDLLAPAIHYAEEGYAIPHRIHHDWALFADKLAQDENAKTVYLKDGRAPKIGEIHRNPKLADVLRSIAGDGPSAFYEGWIAEDVVEYLNGLGGLHTLDDFAEYKGAYETPIKGEYKGYDVYQCPPNGQGVVALAILNMMKHFDLESLDPVSVERFHLEIEMDRLAYNDRDKVLGDPKFTQVPMEHWLSEEHTRKNAALIKMDKALDPLPASTLPAHESTVYLSVVDKDRNAASFINTLFWPFGSALMSPNTGMLLHNRAGGFIIEPGHPNCIQPGKRPLHTIIPGMLVKDGKAVMPYGVMGGSYQPAGHAHLISNLFDYGMDLQSAIDGPRLFPGPGGGPVDVETSIPDHVQEGLRKLGHKTQRPARPVGGAQAVWIDWDNGTLTGASDPRKDGQATGY